MDVIAIGSEVLLDGTVSARVTAIQIRGEGVSYEVVWWNDRERKVEWVEAWEVKPDGEKTRTEKLNPVL